MTEVKTTPVKLINAEYGMQYGFDIGPVTAAWEQAYQYNKPIGPNVSPEKQLADLIAGGGLLSELAQLILKP